MMNATTAAYASPGSLPECSATIAFCDAGYLHRAICRTLQLNPHTHRLDVERVRNWIIEGRNPASAPNECRRINWYDAALDPGSPHAGAQQRYLHAIGTLDRIQTRLGTLRQQGEERQPAGMPTGEMVLACRHPLTGRRSQQGVDVLIAVDLVRLAERRAVNHALLLSGDGDLTPAVEAIRDAGVLISILTPEPARIASSLRRAADQTITIPARQARLLLRQRPGKTADSQSPNVDAQPSARNATRSQEARCPARPVLRLLPATPDTHAAA